MLTINDARTVRRLATNWQSLPDNIKDKVYTGLCLSNGSLIKRDSSVLSSHSWFAGLTNAEKEEVRRQSNADSAEPFPHAWVGTYTGTILMTPDNLVINPSPEMANYLINCVFYPVAFREAATYEKAGKEFAWSRVSRQLWEVLNASSRDGAESVILPPYLGIELSLFPSISGSIIDASPKNSVSIELTSSIVDLFSRPRLDKAL